jgi:hypothetical protein
MLPRQALMARAGTNAYQAPSAEELLYFDASVLTPLQALVTQGYRDGDWSPEARRELASIAAAAAVLGYELIALHDPTRAQDYLILTEPAPTPERPRRHWGTYIFRLGPAQPLIIQAPRPLFEIKTLELSLKLFADLDARALLIGDAHPKTNRDHSADLVNVAHPPHLFNLVAEVLMRETSPRPQLIAHVRAMGQTPGEPLPSEDFLLSFANGASAAEQVGALGRELMARLRGAGWTLGLIGGGGGYAAYQVGGLAQARFLSAVENQDLAILWASPLARASLTHAEEVARDSARFDALGIATEEVALVDWLVAALATTTGAAPSVAPSAPSSAATPPAVTEAVRDYLETENLVRLADLQQAYPALRLERLLDRASQHPFLAAHWDGRLALVANLSPSQWGDAWVAPAAALSPARLKAFIQQGQALLEIQP